MTTPAKKIIQSFRRELKKQRKHVNTIRSYTNDVALFIDWLASSIGPDFSFQEITESDIKDFRAYLLTRNTPASSINRRLTALRQFFEFIVAEKLCTINPVSAIPALQTTSQMPIILSRKEQLLLLRTVEKLMRQLESSILLLLLHAGLRSSEICGLTIGDLHLTPRKAKLFIRSDQGKKLRFVNLTSRTQAALYIYCKRKGISILSRIRRDQPLFVQPNGTPVTQPFIDNVVKRIGKLAGLAYITPTILRNTYAVQTLINGEAPDKVGRALGMSSVKGLQRIAELLQKENSS